MKSRFNKYDNELELIRKEIQQFHVNALPKCKSCIITDYKEIYYSESDSLSHVNELIFMELNYLQNVENRSRCLRLEIRIVLKEILCLT